MLLGERLKELRMERNMSQQELGNLLGITKVSVCGYENGTRSPSIDTLCEIARVFGVSTDYLLGMEIPIIANDIGEYIGAISKEDIEIIYNLRRYPSLYNNMFKDATRFVALVNKKMR